MSHKKKLTSNEQKVTSNEHYLDSYARDYKIPK